MLQFIINMGQLFVNIVQLIRQGMQALHYYFFYTWWAPFLAIMVGFTMFGLGIIFAVLVTTNLLHLVPAMMFIMLGASSTLVGIVSVSSQLMTWLSDWLYSPVRPEKIPLLTKEQLNEKEEELKVLRKETKTIRENLKKLGVNEDTLEDTCELDIPLLDAQITASGSTFDKHIIDKLCSTLEDNRVVEFGIEPTNPANKIVKDECKSNVIVQKLISILNEENHSPNALVKAINSILIDDITKKPLSLAEHIYFDRQTGITTNDKGIEGQRVQNFMLEAFVKEYQNCDAYKNYKENTIDDNSSIAVLIKNKKPKIAKIEGTEQCGSNFDSSASFLPRKSF